MKLEERFNNLSQKKCDCREAMCNCFTMQPSKIKECVEITYEYAIRFNNWVNENAYKYPTKATTEQLLELYNKTL